MTYQFKDLFYAGEISAGGAFRRCDKSEFINKPDGCIEEKENRVKLKRFRKKNILHFFSRVHLRIVFAEVMTAILDILRDFLA